VAWFITKVLIALSALLGLAILDLGPRASAGFTALVSPPPDAAWAADGTGRGARVHDDPLQTANAWPPSDPSTPTQYALTDDGESSTGTSSSSCPSSNARGPVPLLAAGVDPTPPALMLRFRFALSAGPTSELISSIFEPPKTAR
jgi:hypothetical protein